MDWFWCVLAALVVLVGRALADLDRAAAGPDAPPDRRGAGRLDAQLARRSGAALELATSGTLDPAARCCWSTPPTRPAAAGPTTSSRPSRTSRRRCAPCSPSRPSCDALREDPTSGRCSTSWPRLRKVELARRFHNDVVVSARALRSRRRVRWLRLAGRAAELQHGRPGRRAPARARRGLSRGLVRRDPVRGS